MKRTAKRNVPNPVEVPAPALLPNARAYRMGKCTIFIERHKATGYHMSISHPKRYPSWDEIAHARYVLMPEFLTFAMLLPPEAEYLNVDENCFHLHEINTERKMMPIFDPTGKQLGVEPREILTLTKPQEPGERRGSLIHRVDRG